MGQQTLLWVGARGRADVEQVETAARELGIRVRTCGHQEVLDVVRQARFGIVGLELGDDSERGLALLRDLGERLPQASIFVASGDSNVATMRRALEAGASPEQIHHALLALTSTIGFPTVVAALSWAGDVLEGEK